MTVGLSNSWTSDLSFEISDLLIYVMTYKGDSGFPWLVVHCAGCSQAPPGTLYNTSHDVQVYHGAIFRLYIYPVTT